MHDLFVYFWTFGIYLGSSQIETESSQFSHLYKNIDIYFLKNIYLQYRKRTCIQYNPH